MTKLRLLLAGVCTLALLMLAPLSGTAHANTVHTYPGAGGQYCWWHGDATPSLKKNVATSQGPGCYNVQARVQYYAGCGGCIGTVYGPVDVYQSTARHYGSDSYWGAASRAQWGSWCSWQADT